MAKFIVFSDFHLWKGWPEFNPVSPSGLTKRLEIQLDVWKQVEAYGIANNVTSTLFAGDLFNKRSYFHNTEINTLIELYKYSELTHVIISGNHDRLDQNFNSVQFLNGINETKVLPLPISGIDHVAFLDGEKAVIIAGATPGGKIPDKPTFGATNPYSEVTYILLAHGTLNGAKSQSGFELEGGYTLKDFEEWDFVALGDIHVHQIKGNVLIPGSTQQMNWGDCNLSCGCWLLNTEQPQLEIGDCDREWRWKQVGSCWVKFLPLKAPRFIAVTKENYPEVIKTEFDDFNYYDFRLAQEIDQEYAKELKRRFPNSYLSVTEAKRVKSSVSISQKTNTPKEILEKYYDLRIKGTQKDLFVEKGMLYLYQADPNQVASIHKDLQIEAIKAENFLCFENVELDFTKLKRSLYQITGSSDDETSTTNNIGKSSLLTEIVCFGLYGTLARSANRSKDKLILDPQHTGKGKNLFVELTVKISDQRYKIQRFRKHDCLGTGSRILKEKVINES